MQGEVKWFDVRKGFGFIGGDDKNDYFAHYSEISGTGYRNLEAGQRVEFTAQADKKGLKAADIVVLDDEPGPVFRR